MSLRYEQYEALRRTKELLYDLLDPKKRPKNVKDIKDRVSRCLRHFPMLTEKGQPIFSRDPFTQD
jgi:hypothetical protein